MHDAARGHFRAHARRRVRLDVVLEGGAGPRQAQMTDASIAGAGLELGEGIETSEQIVVVISTAALWEPLRAPARVVWTSPMAGGRWRAGCVFEDADTRGIWEMIGGVTED